MTKEEFLGQRWEGWRHIWMMDPEEGAPKLHEAFQSEDLSLGYTENPMPLGLYGDKDEWVGIVRSLLQMLEGGVVFTEEEIDTWNKQRREGYP